ncbi:hypothetical protein [Streptomyces sp. enrichment culture]|uniref:hypothetical protein n=1 Tax=Streptomyces sp. enrichment culture TaxID=1795815 RepID=UPI003F5602E6
MSEITFKQLVQVARDTQPADLGDACQDCGSAAGERCAASCPARRECARDEIADLIGDLPREDLERLVRAGLERDMSGDRVAGFDVAWAAVDDEAQARGLGAPVGV